MPPASPEPESTSALPAATLVDFHRVRTVQTYRRRPPRVFNVTSLDDNLLIWYYSHISQMQPTCSEEGFYKVQNCYVYEGTFIIQHDMCWLADSVTDYSIRAEILSTLINLINDRHSKYLDVNYLDRPKVVISTAGYQNYGHCITDILPKLVNIRQSGLKSITLIIPNRFCITDTIIKDVCSHIGLSIDIVRCPDASLFSCEEVLYFSPVSIHNTTKSPTLIAFVDIIRGTYGIVPTVSRKLFVARGKAASRQIANYDEVSTILMQRGYEIVTPETMSMIDQIKIFSEASHIVGSLGAGLANSIFSSPSAKLMMFDPGLSDFYYWDLASLAGQEFYWVFTEPIEFWSLARSLSPFSVPLDQLSAALQSFEQ
jgi:capsular polysaccharide biosynthesis protein